MNATAQSILKVLLAGLIFGAGLPAIFAVGVRFWSMASPDEEMAATGVRARPAAYVVSAAAFLVVAAAVVAGILWITKKSLAHYLGITVF